jgi:hypothetical protein
LLFEWKKYSRNPALIFNILFAGFNFSGQDDAFIVQKKNHFQLTCDVALDGTPRFVKRPDGTLQEISYLQVNYFSNFN